MQNLTFSHSEPLACPYCGHLLKWGPDQWRPVFECDRCGRFPDFGSTAQAARDLGPRAASSAIKPVHQGAPANDDDPSG